MTAQTTTFSLGLDDAGDDFEHPRRLLQLPCKSVLAYGGDEGIISCIMTGEEKFQVVQRYDDGVRAIAFSEDGKRVAIGFDSGEIRIVKYDDYEYVPGTPHPFAQLHQKAADNDLLSQDHTTSHEDCFPGPQFDSPIRDLLFLRQDFGSFSLVIASETGMCLVDADSSETISTRTLEHESIEAHGHCGIRGLCVHDQSALMASLAMDGKLCLWDIKMVDGRTTPSVTLAQKESKICIPRNDVGEVHGADAFDRSCRPVFHKTLLATPGQLLPAIRNIQGNQLKTVETTNCEDDGHVESVVAIAFYSNDFLITSGRDRRVIFWECDSESGILKPRGSSTLESAATDFCFLEDYSVYAACANGTCAVIPFPLDLKRSLEVGPKEVPKKTVSQEMSKSINQDDVAEDEVNFPPASTVATSLPRIRFLDDEADEDDSLGHERTVQNHRSTLSTTDVGLLEDADDNYRDLLPTVLGPNVSPTSRGVAPQPAFCVSSTPLDLARRYLCWNHIGTVTILHGEGGMNHRNTVDINFTDSAYKRPVTFTDNMDIILGALGEEGAVFASDLQHDADDDDSIKENLDELKMSETTKEAVKRSHRRRSNQSNKPMGSSLFFYRFETFGSLRDKDWYLQLPDGELAVGSACGQGWAAVITSRRFLRLFSSGGNQGPIVWLDGEPVTMAGRSRFLAVFYHKSCPLADSTQQLEYTLWDATSFAVVSKGSVSCISKGASLAWAGFSNDCLPLAMDSDGMVSMLVPCGESGAAWEWVPVLDTVGLRKSADDQFWPVSVYDGKLVCVPLKGGNTYPDAARRPVTTTLGLRMPLAKSSIAKNTIMEEVSVRSNLALAQKRLMQDFEDADNEQEYVGLCAQVDKVTLKLFVATLDAGKLERALDLVDRLHLEKSFDLAIRLADHNRKLVELIEEAKNRNFFLQDEVGASPTTEIMSRLTPSRQISPDANTTLKRTPGHHVEQSSKRNRVS